MGAELEWILERVDGLRFGKLGLTGQQPWTTSSYDSPAFAVEVAGKRVSGRSADLEVVTIEHVDLGAGRFEEIAHCRYAALGAEAGAAAVELEIDWHMRHSPGEPVLEAWVAVRNVGAEPVDVQRLDSIAIGLDSNACSLLSFTGSWGLEFEPVREPLRGRRVLETLRGRSSHGVHPFFALVRTDGAVLCGAVAWSGNWVFRFEPDQSGDRHLLSGGLHDNGFTKVLAPSERVEAPPVVLALGSDGDLDTTSIPLARVGRQFWAPRNDLSSRLPVEWNHWWPYEDHSIDESVFRANVDVAAEIGVEICTLDAGWFGPSSPDTNWVDVRGDWDVVNPVRFPSGIRALADYVHDKGMRFGIWCEIEALGPKAALAARRPSFPAQREGKPLGYVCLGNPEAAEWAFQTLDRLAGEYDADWIKLDFNLDPGLGCDRTDHGHGAGDGLFSHYVGYYGVLSRFRAAHPSVVLENCSSGGLRIDLGMLRQTHLTFLSDPDWPEHGLQALWGASLMLPANQLLYWGYSEWHGEHRCQLLDPRDPALEMYQVDFYRRLSMVGASGMAWKLPELPAAVRDRLAENNRVYQEVVRPFVLSGDLRRLTEQPQRFGEGSRWVGFQYSLPDAASNLVLLFRLPGGEAERPIPLRGLDPDRSYSVRWWDADESLTMTGRALMEDGLRRGLPEEGSELVLVTGL